jgi:antitoxin MazE
MAEAKEMEKGIDKPYIQVYHRKKQIYLVNGGKNQMIVQLAKWGNSQGIRIPKKMLNSVGIKENTEVELEVKENYIMIKPKIEKDIDYYLSDYDENDRNTYDWGELEESRGREVW